MAVIIGVPIILLSVLLWGQEPEMGNAMTLADKYEQANDIKAKYNLENGALVREVKSDPKDRIEVVIGNKIDDKSFGAETTFEPTLEISRWDEVSFKIIPDISDVALVDRTLTFDKEKILFQTPKMDFEIYDYTEGEGGMKYIWYLNEKPKSRTVCFDMKSLGLDFYYQPPLDEEYPESLNCSPTECDTDGNGELDSFRPEEIIGSYAIYHSTKGVMNDINGKDYKTGKFGHIPTPKLYDSNGWELFAERLLIKDNQYCVVMPEDFWDKAVYPIRSNDTFGYETIGKSNYGVGDYPTGCRFQATSGDGTASSISIALKIAGDGGDYFECAIYDDSADPEYIDETEELAQANITVDQYTTFEFTDGPSITDNAYYYLLGWSERTGFADKYDIWFDTNSNDYIYKSVNYGDQNPTWPKPTFDGSSSSGRTFSIYATYSATAPPAVEPTKKQDVIWFD